MVSIWSNHIVLLCLIEICCCRCSQDLNWLCALKPKTYYAQLCSFTGNTWPGNKVVHMCINIEGHRLWCVSQTIWSIYFLFSVAGCRIHDPQVSDWLLDPTNPSSCYQDLLTKHLRMPQAPPALGAKKVGWDSFSNNFTKRPLIAWWHTVKCTLNRLLILNRTCHPRLTYLYLLFLVCAFRCLS